MIYVSSLGALPSVSQCDDTVGRIQQALNAAWRAGKVRADITGLFPLVVDGKAGVKTKQAIDVVLFKKESWEQNLPGTIYRWITDEVGAPGGEAFSCFPKGAAPGPTSGIPWGWVAGGVGVALLGLALSFSRSSAPTPRPAPKPAPAPRKRPATPAPRKEPAPA